MDLTNLFLLYTYTNNIILMFFNKMSLAMKMTFKDLLIKISNRRLHFENLYRQVLKIVGIFIFLVNPYS